MADFDEQIRMANGIYKDLMVENAILFDAIRKGTTNEIKALLKNRHEDSVRSSVGYALALAKMQIVSTRYYVQGIDITEAMREKIYKDEYHINSGFGEEVIEAIHKYEDMCFKEYLSCAIGIPSEDDKGYMAYINAVKAVNSYKGEVDSERLFEDNMMAFRALVKDLIVARKKCALIANFTIRCVPEDKQDLLNQENLTYEGALELAEIVINNCVAINYGDLGATESDMTHELFENPTPMREEIQEKFVTKHLKNCGLNTDVYKEYISGKVYVTNKKFLISLGIFLEPYIYLDMKRCRDNDYDKDSIALRDNLECFMNQNGQSVNSQFATITECDNMLDGDICYLADIGLSVEMLAYMLKNYAKSSKDIKKK